MDAEARAIDEAWAAISRLSADGRRRVIQYLAGRAAVDATGSDPGDNPDQVGRQFKPFAGGMSQEGLEGDVSGHLRTIFEERDIGTKANKILVAAAIIQERNRGRPPSAREIHQPLKIAGVQISNISAHLDAIIERRGRKQITRITEKSRQNRYQVTATGMKAVGRLLEGSLGG